MKLSFFSAGAIVALVSTAQAGSLVVFASGKLFGGPGQTDGGCYIFNAGSSPATLSGFHIRNGAGAFEEIDNTCPTSPKMLPAGVGCFIKSPLSYTMPYDCSGQTNALANLRGSIEIRKEEGGGPPLVLQSQPMR